MFKIDESGRYGRNSVNAATPMVEYSSAGAGLLLKNGFCVRMTKSSISSVKIESTNQPLWKSSSPALNHNSSTPNVM